MGDGEQQEGQIWEASMFAAHYKLDNLCGIIDYNRKQIDGDVRGHHGHQAARRQVARVQLERDRVPTATTCRRSLARVRRRARAHDGQPSVILAHTVMGQGVSYMADDYPLARQAAQDGPGRGGAEGAGHQLRRVVGAAARPD